MEDITVSTDLLLGLMLGGLIPSLLWAWKMFAMTKQLRDMHLEQAEHGFGSDELKDLLTENLVDRAEKEREFINSNKSLRYAIKELTHFMQWMVKESAGKAAPPFVRGDDD